MLLLALLYTRRKNRNKFDTLLVVLVLLSAVGLSLSAYTPAQAEALPASNGGGVDAPSMPMGYASAAEAGTSSGAIGVANPSSGLGIVTACGSMVLPPMPGISKEDIEDAIYFITGMIHQYIDDMLGGYVDEMNYYIYYQTAKNYNENILPILILSHYYLSRAGINLSPQNLQLMTVPEEEEKPLSFYIGMEWGRKISEAQNSIVFGVGVASIFAAFTVVPTSLVAGGTLCAVVTVGGCALVAAPAGVTAQAATVTAGYAIMTAAVMKTAYFDSNPTPSRQYQPKDFKITKLKDVEDKFGVQASDFHDIKKKIIAIAKSKDPEVIKFLERYGTNPDLHFAKDGAVQFVSRKNPSKSIITDVNIFDVIPRPD